VTPRQVELLEAEFPPPGPVARGRSKGSGVDPKELLLSQIRSYRLPPAVPELRFAKSIGRQWRFDVAFPDFMLAVEIEGIVPRQLWEAKLEGGGPVTVNGYVRNVTSVERTFVVFGRHASVTGLIEDMEKYNTAAMLGWTVIRFPPKQIKPLTAIEMIQRVLAAKGWKPAHAT